MSALSATRQVQQRLDTPRTSVANTAYTVPKSPIQSTGRIAASAEMRLTAEVAGLLWA